MRARLHERFATPGWLAIHLGTYDLRALRAKFGDEVIDAALDPYHVARRRLQREKELLPEQVYGFLPYGRLGRGSIGPLVFDKAAFGRRLSETDIELRVNHKILHAFASTGNGTLRVMHGPDGVYFDARLRRDDYGSDLLHVFKSKRVTGVSCGFTVHEKEARRGKHGAFELIRRATLDEISIMVAPHRPAMREAYAHIL